MALAIGAALVVDVGLFFLLGGVHLGARPVLFVLATQGGSCLLAVWAVWGAFGRGGAMLGRSRRLLLAITILTPLLLLGWMLLWGAVYPEAALAMPERIGLRCLAFSLVLAAWPLAVVIAARRERNPMAPVIAGAARGAAVGALAWVAVSLWCPVASPAHLALGHFLPLIVLSALGSWLGKRLTAVASP